MSALLEHRMDQTVTVYAHSGYSSVGDVQYSTSSATHKARVDAVKRLIKSADGRDVLATTVVYVGYTTAGVAPTITAQSKIVLPDGTTPPILAVETHRKFTGGTDHQAVFFG